MLIEPKYDIEQIVHVIEYVSDRSQHICSECSEIHYTWKNHKWRWMGNHEIESMFISKDEIEYSFVSNNSGVSHALEECIFPTKKEAEEAIEKLNIEEEEKNSKNI
jgi:hypothetical protein